MLAITGAIIQVFTQAFRALPLDENATRKKLAPRFTLPDKVELIDAAAAVQYGIHCKTLADTGSGIVFTGASPAAKANVCGVREIGDL